jgi:hypothetical protein
MRQVCLPSEADLRQFYPKFRSLRPPIDVSRGLYMDRGQPIVFFEGTAHPSDRTSKTDKEWRCHRRPAGSPVTTQSEFIPPWANRMSAGSGPIIRQPEVDLDLKRCPLLPQLRRSPTSHHPRHWPPPRNMTEEMQIPVSTVRKTDSICLRLLVVFNSPRIIRRSQPPQ